MIRRAEIRSATISRQDLLAAFPMELVRDGTDAGLPDVAVVRAASPAMVVVDDPLTLGADMAEAQRVAFTGRLRQAHRSAFAASPEPTYLAIAPRSASSVPTRAELLAGQRFLDVNRSHDFLIYPTSPVDGAKPGIVAASTSLAEASLDIRTILLRPTAQLSMASTFAVFHGENRISG
jgi:hypothetical protein